MSHFWADWDPHSHKPEILRRDTRIFWKAQGSIPVNSRCVGTFVGENPGSGQAASGLHHFGTDVLVDRRGQDGDPTLRLVLNIWQHAVTHYGMKEPLPTDYIEVLNTYYFRNAKTTKAFSAWVKAGGHAVYFPSFSTGSQFALLGWGVDWNRSSEACRAANMLRGHPKVIVPCSKGSAKPVAGAHLSVPPSPAPPAPSYVLNRSKTLLPIYVANIARHL